MGYKKPPPKLTFYKAFFSAQWKFLIHTLVQYVSDKRTAWNEFNCFMASVVICLATGRKSNFSKYIFDSMARNVDIPSKILMYLRFLQVIINTQVDDLTYHNTRYTSPTLTQKVFANIRIVVAELEQDKHTHALEILKLKKRVKKLEKKRRSKHSGFKRLRKVETTQRVESSNDTIVGAQNDASKRGGEIVAIDADKDITLVDMEKDEETLIKMKAEKTKLLDEQIAQRLYDDEVKKAAAREKQEKDDLKRAKVAKINKPVSIAQARKNMIIYLKNMAGYKMKHFRGMNYDKVRPIFKREYKKVQILFKPDKDVEEPKKKRVAEKTLLQESFKKLKAVKVSGSEFTQETPSNDLKEMSEEDIIRVGGITKPYQSFEDVLKGFDKEDLVALWNLVKEKFSTVVPSVDKEKALWVELKRLFEPDADDVPWKLQKKDYPLSNGVMTLMLSAKLQVEEDSEMARDLVMKIFQEDNKPKSRSLDTSSK
uniref:Glutamic acid-rich protein-like n=1 Tax=Tanacetum cinerariifolium TaxID=118510 RepID=A0A699H161_TANCI|nr:hypothetical protein [Tanacetum cinerariifolium]